MIFNKICSEINERVFSRVGVLREAMNAIDPYTRYHEKVFKLHSAQEAVKVFNEQYTRAEILYTQTLDGIDLYGLYAPAKGSSTSLLP